DILTDSELIDPSEASAVALDDDKILLNIRNENPVKRRYLSLFDVESMLFDNIGFCDTLPDPTCFAGMVSDGKTIFYSGCDSTDDRINLKIKISKDEGKTFSESKFISEFAGYSDIAVSDNGNELYVFYEMCMDDIIELHFQAIKL
ncbi:MAG: exo-alpha-sialidase, partial [Ruminococcus sp.]|nr:exo-alpha-sialidase [Candidatus Copronaster equi]